MKGRMPACSTVSLAGKQTTSGLIPGLNKEITYKHPFKPVKDNIHNTLIDQGLPCGNRIGHHPFNPKTFKAPDQHKRPHSILDVIRDFSHSYFEAKLHKSLYYHLDQMGNYSRQIRSEFREMISMGCSILTHYYDVLTGCVGFQDSNGNYIHLSYQQLAERLNVSLIRVKRFFNFLKERKFVTIVENRKKDEHGNWKSNSSKKIINSSFFINTLGIKAWEKIKSYREWLYKKARPKTHKEIKNMSILQSIMGQANTETRKIKSPSSVNQQKQNVEKALLLYERDPSRSLSDYLKDIQNNKI